MHKIWELTAIKHTEVQPDVFEHEHKLQTNSLKLSINKRFTGQQPVHILLCIWATGSLKNTRLLRHCIVASPGATGPASVTMGASLWLRPLRWRSLRTGCVYSASHEIPDVQCRLAKQQEEKCTSMPLQDIRGKVIASASACLPLLPLPAAIIRFYIYTPQNHPCIISTSASRCT